MLEKRDLMANIWIAAKSPQLCRTLCDPIDGSPIPGILQARTLEWVAISFSNAWKWKVKVKSLSRVRLLATPWTATYQAPPSMGFSRQEYWSGVPLPSPNIWIRIIKRQSLQNRQKIWNRHLTKNMNNQCAHEKRIQHHSVQFSSFQFSHSVVSDSLRPQESQHASCVRVISVWEVPKAGTFPVFLLLD